MEVSTHITHGKSRLNKNDGLYQELIIYLQWSRANHHLTGLDLWTPPSLNSFGKVNPRVLA